MNIHCVTSGMEQEKSAEGQVNLHALNFLFLAVVCKFLLLGALCFNKALTTEQTIHFADTLPLKSDPYMSI